MTEIDEHEAKKQERIDGPRRLELKKTVETGQVRQSFAHGRSKMVTVEVRKKRTFAPDARGRMAEVRRGLELDAAKALDGSAQSAQPDGLPREGAAIGLTSQEKAARARALHDAIRIEEERHAAPGMEQMPALVDTPPLEAETPTTAEATVEQPIAVAREVEPTIEPPAESVAEPEPAEALATAVTAGTATTETELRQASPEEPPSHEETIEGKAKTAPDLALVKPKLPEADDEEVEKRGRSKRPVRADARKAASGVRRTEPGRRTGRLSLVDALDDGAEQRVRSLASVRRAREKERLKQQLRAEATKVIRDVVIPETITVQELANRMAERSADVIKSLMRMGVMATINHAIDADTAELLVTEFGHNVKRVSDADVEIGLKGESDDESDLQPRPAVVTVMGHVDHGKTSLLDALRKTNVVAQEAGGITQYIGAYQIALPGGEKITFIDTPGHEAFTQMRARGARVTDIVVLVVAADDGIMPQTVEAINHAKAANVPIVVAINKIDRPDANPARIRTDLLQHGVVLEEMGGETLCVEVSAKQGTNLDKLLETIVLQAELLDLRTNPNRTAEGVVVETKIERGRGSVATVLVQRGTLRTGDIFVAGSEWGRVRGLTDANGMALDSAGPSTPVEVLGLNGTPAAGDDVVVVESEARAREVTEFRQRRMRDARVTTSRGTFEQMLNRIQEGGEKQLPVVVKADVHGSMEAIVGALEKLSTDQAKAQILHAGIGGINESDVTLAGASNALIIGFNVRANPQARELAQRDGVEIRYYSIIYDLTDDLRKVLSGMLAPKLRETILGYAEIREVFSISKVGKVAGCMVIEGVIRRGARVRLLRDNVVVHEGELGQLKRFKDDVKEVREGYDCGVALSTYQDIQVGDTIECFEFREVMREP